MKIRRVLAVTGIAITVGLSAVVIDGAPALAESCPAARDVYISGGESHYTITCSGGNVYVNGRVTDTASDGMCAKVKALINGTWHYSNNACPKGETEYFSWSGPGSSASVYTYLQSA